MVLYQISCICYLIWFKKKKIQIQALIDSNSKVKAMTLGYALKLNLKVCFTNIRLQKIDGSTLKMLEIVLASFQVEDMFKKAWFFQKIFLLADLSV